MSIKISYDNIDLDDVIYYLENNNWTRIGHINSKIITFVHNIIRFDSGEPVFLILPKDKTFLDSEIRFIEAINLLSIIGYDNQQDIMEEIFWYDKIERKIVWNHNQNNKEYWSSEPSLEKYGYRIFIIFKKKSLNWHWLLVDHSLIASGFVRSLKEGKEASKKALLYRMTQQTNKFGEKIV